MIRLTVFLGLAFVIGQGTGEDDTTDFPISNELPAWIDLGEGFEVTLFYEIVPPLGPDDDSSPSVEVDGVRVWYETTWVTIGGARPIHTGLGGLVVSSNSWSTDTAYGIDDVHAKVLLLSPQNKPRMVAGVVLHAPDYKEGSIVPVGFIDDHLVLSVTTPFEDNRYAEYLMYITGDWDGGTGVGDWGKM